MSDENKPRRLRAIFKNAVVWGGVWGVLGTAVSAMYRLNDNIPFLNAILDGIGMGIRIGVVGALSGAAFATFISVKYRGQRLSEISAAKFGGASALFTGLFVPAWMQSMNLLTGGGLVPFNLIDGDMLMAAAFGGITAAGTLLMAQRDESKNPVTVQELLDQMERQSLGPGDTPQYNATQRSRSTEQY